MKLSDLKLLMPRLPKIGYSKHTPKEKPYKEGYFMNAIKAKNLESQPAKDEFCNKTKA